MMQSDAVIWFLGHQRSDLKRGSISLARQIDTEVCDEVNPRDDRGAL
jgi:hypothetical protein